MPINLAFKVHNASDLLWPVANNFAYWTNNSSQESMPTLSQEHLCWNQDPAFLKLHDNSCRNFATAQGLVIWCPWWTEMLFKGVRISDWLHLGQDRQHSALPKDQV